MDNPAKLIDRYMRIYAITTKRLSGDKNKLSVLTIGGGGYVYPQYIEKVWPGSRIDVVEIDQDMTKAAVQAFGLKKDSSINTIRSHPKTLLRRITMQPS